MSETYSLGLTFTAPSAGDTDWADVEDAKHTRLSLHDHTGAGLGTQIATGALANNAVSEAKIRLANNAALRARNAAGSADLNLMKATTGNFLEVLLPLVYGATSTETLSSNGAISTTTAVTVLATYPLTMTLADGTLGQLKLIYNSNSTGTSTVTPATTTTPNTVALLPYGIVLYYFGPANSAAAAQWIPIPGNGCVVTDDIRAVTATSGTYDPHNRIITFNNAGATTATFNAGLAGQRCTVYNIGAGNVDLTLSGSRAAADVLTIPQFGIVELVMIDGDWQPIAGNHPVTITYA